MGLVGLDVVGSDMAVSSLVSVLHAIKVEVESSPAAERLEFLRNLRRSIGWYVYF